jgi:nicotinamide-nucleotide amidase
VGQTRVFVVPGVPVEMRDMFKRQIVPRLPAGHGSIVHHIVHTFGAGESTVGMKIAPWMRRGANPTVGTTVADGLVSVRVVARGDSHDAADALACKTVAEIRDCLGELVVAEEEATMAHAVGSLLASFGQTVATAESCTGGLIGSMLTDVPGSSGYYRGGVVAYDNDVKVTMLDVPRDLLIDHGAVSEPVAAAMAQGARIRLAADWAVSVTGIAGPGGGTDEKPVGLVYMGLAGPNGATNVASRQFSGPRGVVRLRAALAALNELRLALLRRR